MREDKRQGCYVWVSFLAPFPSWIAPPNYFFSVVCWNSHGSWRIWIYRFLAFQQLRMLIWLCSHCVTLATSYQVSVCTPLPLSMKSVLLYPCYHFRDAPARAEMPCRVCPQWQDASLGFLRVSYPSLPALGWYVTSKVLVHWHRGLVLMFSCFTHSHDPKYLFSELSRMALDFLWKETDLGFLTFSLLHFYWGKSQHIKLTTNHYKIYISVVFSAFTVLYNHDHSLILRHFHRDAWLAQSAEHMTLISGSWVMSLIPMLGTEPT